MTSVATNNLSRRDQITHSRDHTRIRSRFDSADHLLDECSGPTKETGSSSDDRASKASRRGEPQAAVRLVRQQIIAEASDGPA